MNDDINFRRSQLALLRNYRKDVDDEITMILQNFQWDRKHLTERKGMVACQYDTNHKVPPDKLVEHENRCFLKSQGYTDCDRLLPSPIATAATTLVILNTDSIKEIIENASRCQPSFNTGAGCSGHQPFTLERLQTTYTPDERRAIHDAVVNQVPSCHDLSDLALLSSKDDVGKESRAKTKLEILAELRDMRRRRTKYRVAAKTRNYSDVLRDVITTQMELYTQAHNLVSQIQMKSNDPDSYSKEKDISSEKHATRHSDHTQINQNRNYHINEEQTSAPTNDIYNISRYSRKHEEHDGRKRRYNESDHDSIPGSRKADQYKDDNYDSKSKKRNDRDNSAKTNSINHKYHNRHESRSRQRENEFESIKKTRIEEQSKIKNDCHDYGKFKEKNHNYERHHSSMVRHDYSYKGAMDKQKRHNDKRKQDQSVIIKKEKDHGCDDISNSSGDDISEYTDRTPHNSETQYCNIKKIKLEGKVHVKTEGNNIRNDHVKNYGSKSSDTFNEREQSRKYYKYSRSKDSHSYYHKNSANYNDTQQEDHRESVFQIIKVEKDKTYKKPSESNEARQEKSIAYNSQYKNRTERCENSDDKYRKEKEKKKRRS